MHRRFQNLGGLDTSRLRVRKILAPKFLLYYVGERVCFQGGKNRLGGGSQLEELHSRRQLGKSQPGQ